jgi:uncharacterized membrane protein (UPF0127 family)
MRRVFILNQTNPAGAPIQAPYCDSFFGRFRGLMFRKSLAQREGLLLVEASESRLNAAIHMLFMRFDLAVIWINDDMRVVDAQLARRWRASYVPAKPARFTLETRAEYLPEFHIGDQILFTNAT